MTAYSTLFSRQSARRAVSSATGDALVINDDTGGCILQLLGQRRHDGLLFGQTFALGIL